MTELESFLIGFVIGQISFTLIRAIAYRKRTYRFIDAIAAVQRDHSSRIYTLEHVSGIPHPAEAQDLVARAFRAGQLSGAIEPWIWISRAIASIFRRR